MLRLHSRRLLPALHRPHVADHYPGTALAVTWPSLVSPDLNTVGEEFITETAAVVRPGVSEAFPPCQEK